MHAVTRSIAHRSLAFLAVATLAAAAPAQTANWVRTYPPAEPTVVDVASVNALEHWAVAADGSVSRTTNGGIAWTASSVPSASIVALAARGSFAWAVGAGIHRTADAGATWATIAATSGLSDVFFASNTHGFVVGDAGRILRSTDGGTSFTNAPAPIAAARWRAVHAPTTTVVWAVGESGACARSTDGGVSWTVVPAPAPGILFDVVALDAQRAFVAAGEVVWRTADGGANWAASTLPADARAERLSVLGGTWIWAAGGTSRIAHSADGGVTWSSSASAGGPLVRDVSMGDLTRGIAGGEDGRLWRTDDGGATWILAQGGGSTPARLVTDVVQRGASSAWASATDGVILRSTNGGETWNEVVAGLATTIFRAVDFAPDGLEGYAVGKRQGFYPTTSYTLDGGLTWQTTYWLGMYDFEDVDALGNGVAVACSTSGVLRTTNHGISWSFVTTFPQFDPYGADFVDAQLGYAVGLGAMKTTDGGATWQVTASFAARALDVSFSDADRGWAVGEQGSILRTVDGGLTWTSQSAGVATPTLYAVEAISSDVAWIAGANGFAARTNDGGATWSVLAPADHGAAEFFGAWFDAADHGWLAGYWPNAGLWRREPASCAVANYCTGKATHLGLVPALSAVGSPSAAAGSFVVRGSNLLPDNVCLLVHSTVGPASVPFLGGTRCVATPFTRLGLRNADANGFVDYVVPVQSPMIATTRWYQMFQRDLLLPDGTGAASTGGLEVSFCD